ncbi:hypothetical protein STEG23_031873 [Scotinomys teguina]
MGLRSLWDGGFMVCGPDLRLQCGSMADFRCGTHEVSKLHITLHDGFSKSLGLNAVEWRKTIKAFHNKVSGLYCEADDSSSTTAQEGSNGHSCSVRRVWGGRRNSDNGKQGFILKKAPEH